MTATCDIADSVEAAAWADLLTSAPATVRASLGLEVHTVGPATALVCRAGGILLNRVIGATSDPEELARVTALYKDRGVDRFFVHVYTETLDAEAARFAGLERYPRAWVKLARARGPNPTVSTDLTVEKARPDDLAAAGLIYARAFDLPDAFAPAIAALADRPKWHITVARAGGEVASVGLLYVARGVGYLAGGATAPEHRQRGAQGAVMAERVRMAMDLGCRWMTTETGEAAPGDPQHSYRNMVRCGFQVVAVRHNYAPANTTWRHGRRQSS